MRSGCFLAAVLLVGGLSACSGTGSTGGDGGDGGSGATGGTGGEGATGGTNGTGGMGGEGGTGAALPTSPTVELETAFDEFAAIACLCAEEVPTDTPEPACLAEIPLVRLIEEERPCADSALSATPEANDWVDCRLGAATAATDCWSSITECDADMLSACQGQFFGTLSSPTCQLSASDFDALSACATPTAESLLSTIVVAVNDFCTCSANPGSCIDIIGFDEQRQTCILDAIDLGLDSGDAEVVSGTADAVFCLGQEYRRWQFCVSFVTFCDLDELDACNDRYAPDLGACEFPNDPPESVQAAFENCFFL